MNAQQSTSTQIADTRRSRTIMIIFAGLLVLAVAIIGSVLALSQRASTADIVARGPTNHLLIAHCRACQDEALAARQGVGLAGEQAWLPSVVRLPPHALITNCRVCRDEVWGGIQVLRQAGQPAAAVPAVGRSPRVLIKNCRACQDEALAAIQASFSASDDLVSFREPDDARGPRPR